MDWMHTLLGLGINYCCYRAGKANAYREIESTIVQEQIKYINEQDAKHEQEIRNLKRKIQKEDKYNEEISKFHQRFLELR